MNRCMQSGMCILVLAVLGCGEEVQEEAAVVRPVKMLTLGGGTTASSLEYPGAWPPCRTTASTSMTRISSPGPGRAWWRR